MCSAYSEINTEHRPAPDSRKHLSGTPMFSPEPRSWVTLPHISPAALCFSNGVSYFSAPTNANFLESELQIQILLLQKHYQTLFMCQLPSWVLGIQNSIGFCPSFKELTMKICEKINKYSQYSKLRDRVCSGCAGCVSKELTGNLAWHSVKVSLVQILLVS